MSKTDTTKAAMDHAKMAEMKKADTLMAAMSGMDHSKMAGMKKPDTAQMSAMDHMKMSGMMSDSIAMMKLHKGLMADPVIHKRIMADTALRALMMKAMGDSSMMRDMKSVDHSKMPGMKMPPDTTKKKPPR